MVKLPKSFWLIAPFAVWLILMTVLPATTWAYAIRTGVVAFLLLCACGPSREKIRAAIAWRALWPGLLVGLAVFTIWILPEQFDWVWYRRFCIIGEGGTQAVAEACAAMIAVRLIGSALVISIAEELFFRKWLIGFAGFWPMVVLFAVEHDRWLVAALCGIAYGWLYLRRGLGAACVAHVTTNLALGLWVLRMGQWQFW